MVRAEARELPEPQTHDRGRDTSRESPRAERAAVWGLVAGMAVSALTILVFGRDLGFWSDELDWLTFGTDFTPEALLTPHNSHLIAVPRVIYELLPRLFGADYLPFRLLSIAAVLACAALFFVLARRRVGGPAALAPAILLLLFGSSSEVVLSPLGLPISLSVAFGLATFVAIERDTRGADLAATALLALSVLSDTFGTIIAGGVAIYLLLDPSRRRRIWIAAIPIALWIGWWVWAQQFDQDIALASNLPGVPLFVLESAAATLGAITGVGKSFGIGGDSMETVVQVGFVTIALVGAALIAARARRVGATPPLWAFALTLLGFWVALALAESDVRQPSTPRYLLFAAIMIFLVLAEAFRGERLRGRILVVYLVVFGACLAGNLARLAHNADGLTERADVVGAQLAMIELAGDAANPAFSPNSVAPRGSSDIVAAAGALIPFTERYGSLGLSLDEVRDQPEQVRADADFVLARAVSVLVLPMPKSSLVYRARCRSYEAEATDPARFRLRPEASLIRIRSGASELLLGRFGDDATVPVGELSAGELALIGLPSDAEPERWYAEVTAPIEVCGVVGDPEA